MIMKNKVYVIGAFIFILFLNSCIKESKKEVSCRFDQCGSFDLSCNFGEPVNCLAVYQPGDGCRAFVECDAESSSCSVQKSKYYDECVTCFKSCENYNEWSNCTSACDKKYKEILSIKD